MRKTSLISFLLIISFFFFTNPAMFGLDKSYATCFTPSQQCGDVIVSQINKAERSIFVQAYGFTSKKIIDALVQAKNRGLQVEIILDRSNFHEKKNDVLKLLQNNQIQIYQDKVAGIAHNKVMIIDDNIVITGSFNFTENADKRNAENIIVMTNNDIAKAYYQNWLLRAKFSK